MHNYNVKLTIFMAISASHVTSLIQIYSPEPSKLHLWVTKLRPNWFLMAEKNKASINFKASTVSSS